MNSLLLVSVMMLGAADLHPVLHVPPDRPWFETSTGPQRATRWTLCLRLTGEDVRSSVQEQIESIGGRTRSTLKSMSVIVCDVPPTAVAAIAGMEGVLWIEPVLPALMPCMDTARSAVGIDTLQDGPPGLTGLGQRVAVIETGLPDQAHGDLLNRIYPWDNGATTEHATHVTGIIAGDGTNQGGQFSGVAPEVVIDAWVISNIDDYYFFTDPGNLESIYEDELDTFDPAVFNQSLGSNIQQNGYPCSLHGDYGIASELLDGLARGSLGSPAMSVWAAGNERAWNECGYDYGTIGQPATAKNVISVGSVYSDTNVVSIFSSWGPTDDGRIKPDLVAPGSQLSGDFGITSCQVGGGYTALSGTSMATPIVSGTIALLSQAHEEAWPGEARLLPSTWRAILCHTATDLWQTGPDYRYGWGLLDAEAAHSAVTGRDWVESHVIHEGLVSTVLTVEDPSEPLRITLAWDDFPAIAGSQETLVHDLDLLVIDPEGTMHHPWTLDPQNPSLPASRNSWDHVNPIEQVLVDAPIPGTWEVHVMGTSIADTNGQSFSLVCNPPVARTVLAVAEVPEHGIHWQPTSIEVTIDVAGETIIDGSPMVHASVDGSEAIDIPLVQVSGTRWGADLPPAACGSTIEWWFEVDSSLTGHHRLPQGAPGQAFQLPVGDSLTTLFLESFDEDQGWAIESNATSGFWARAVPTDHCTDDGEPGVDSESGSTFCALTGPGNNWGCLDVDGGCTSFISPSIQVMVSGVSLAYSRWFHNSSCGHNYDDGFSVDFTIDGGSTWLPLEFIDPDHQDTGGGWVDRAYMLDKVPGFQPTDQFQLRFTACDQGMGHCVEAAVDAVSLVAPSCALLCRHDIANADGQVDVSDLLSVIDSYGSTDPAADFDGNGIVAIDDLLALMVAWGSCQ